MDNFAEKGSLLKKTRLARGITLEMVHETTKIPIDALKALEEGYTIRSMTPFYQRGFLKMYAQYLNLDITTIVGERKPSAVVPPPIPEEPEAIEDIPPPPPVVPKQSFKDRVKAQRERERVYKEEEDEEVEIYVPPPKPKPVKEKIKIPQIPKPSLPTLPPIDFQKIFSDIFTPQRVSLLLKGVGILLLVFFFLKFTGCILHKISENAKKPRVVRSSVPSERKVQRDRPPKPNVPDEVSHPVAAATPAVTVAPVAVPVVVQPPLQPQPVPVVEPMSDVDMKKVEAEQKKMEEEAAKSEEPVPVKEVMLTVRAKKNSWLQVKVDGIIVFQAVLKKGVTESWSGDRDIELSGKNINQLEFEVNGKTIGVLGRDESRAKKVIINKNGLSVKK